MRKVLFVVAALASLALASRAFALVNEEKDVPVTDNNGAVASGTVSLQTADGKTIAKADIKGGKADLKVDERDITPKTKVVVKIHVDADLKTGKPAKDIEKRDEPVGVFLNKGLNVDTLGPAIASTAAASNIVQHGLAVHHPVVQKPAPFRIAEDNAPLPAGRILFDRTFFEFGFGGGESWTKTNADSFGPSIGPGTFFPHTNSSAFFTVEAGAFVPVVPGVAAGPVMELVTGDFNTTTLTQTTPSGVISSSQISRGLEFDAMGRVYLAFPFSYWNGSIYVQGGVAVARYTGSLVNAGIETFQGSALTTSPIVGGGLEVPACQVLGIPADQSGVCTLTFYGEYNHVAVKKTFDTGITAASSATAQVKSEDRVMAGFRFITSTASGPPQGYLAPVLSDIRLKRDIAEVGISTMALAPIATAIGGATRSMSA